MKTKVSIITVVLSILQTSPDQFRAFKSGSLLSIFESISPFCIHVLYMYWYCCVGKLVSATLCLYTNMLLVPHWYCCLYVLVLWVLLVHWYQPLYVSVPICYWYCWYIGTSHFTSLYQYVTGTALVLLFICTGTVGTVGTLVPATLCLCTNMLLVLHWYCCLYVLALWVLLVHWYQPLYVWYCTGTALYM